MLPTRMTMMMTGDANGGDEDDSNLVTREGDVDASAMTTQGGEWGLFFLLHLILELKISNNF